MLIVQKYGGTSVANNERIRAVASRVAKEKDAHNKIIVVLSAQGDTTDELIKKASELSKVPAKRELDMLLSTGEQQSVALLAIALNEMGYSAVSLNSMQVGIKSSSVYGSARIKDISDERISAELDRNNIVIITGFQGVNQFGDITTLGRGGSDTTAVAIAAALKADICEIYTDVDGVYTADPRIVRSAKKIKEISYDEMLELATLGSKVLHHRSVEIAKKYGVKLVVRSSFTDEEGTVVKEGALMEQALISGLAIDKDTARISIIGVDDEPGMAFRIFSLLAKAKIPVDIIIQSKGGSNKKDISFTVTKADFDIALEILNTNADFIGYDHLDYDKDVAKLSIVGAGMATNSGVAQMMFEAFYDSGINIELITTSEIKITVLVKDSDVEYAANFVHEKFLNHKTEVDN